MVDITPLVAAGQQIIQSYGANGFRVSGVAYDGPIIVTPGQTVPWPAGGVEMLDMDDFTYLIGHVDEKPDVLLLGTGARMILPPAAVRQGLRAAGIIVEPMDTGAACRTYNVLLGDGRRVAAALMI